MTCQDIFITNNINVMSDVTEQNRTFISDLYIVHHHIHNNIQVTCTFQCNQYKEINNINNIKK
jgi:hypothetical protein